MAYGNFLFSTVTAASRAAVQASLGSMKVSFVSFSPRHNENLIPLPDMKLADRFDTNMALMRSGGYNHLQMMPSTPIYYLNIKMAEVVMLASEMDH